MPHIVERAILGLLLVCGAVLTCGCGGPSATPTPPKWPALVLSKETTYITEPVDAEGFPDYGAAINARLSAGVTPENNAYVGLMQIYGPADYGPVDIDPELKPLAYELLKMPPLPESGSYLADGKAYFAALKGDDPVRPAYRDEWDRSLETPWTDADAPKMARWLAMNEAPLARVPAALARPRYYRPLLPREKGGGLGVSLDPYIDEHRTLQHLLTMRGLRHLGNGHVEKSAADALLLHRLAQHLATGPNFIDYGLAMNLDWYAMRVEAAIAHHGKLSAAAAKAHAARLAKLPDLPPFQLEWERQTFLDWIRVVAQGRERDTLLFPGLGVTKETCPVAPEQVCRAIDWNETYRVCNESFNEWETAAKIGGVKERSTACGKVDTEFKARMRDELATPVDWKTLDGRQLGRRVGRQLVSLLLSDPSHLLTSCDWRRSHRKLLQVCFALAAYRAEAGSYPNQLAPLVPQHLPQLPIDPWSNQPYRFRLEEGGYVLWGVGPDGKDDGGRDTLDQIMTVK